HALLLFLQAEDGIRDFHVTGVQTCALPICSQSRLPLTILAIQVAPEIHAPLRIDPCRPVCEQHGNPVLQRDVLQLTRSENALNRSEERRVGKECSARRPPYEYRKNSRTREK